MTSHKLTPLEWTLLIAILSLVLFEALVIGFLSSNLQQQVLLKTHPEALYVLPLPWGAFFIPGLLLALFTALFFEQPLKRVVEIIQKKPARLAAPNFFQDQNWAGIDEQRLGQVLMIVLPLLSLVLFGAFFDSYSVITRQGIVENPMFGLGERLYPYGQVQKILHIDKFRNNITRLVEPVKAPYYALIMQDGSKWASNVYSFPDGNEGLQLIDTIARHVGLPIQEGIRNVDDKPGG